MEISGLSKLAHSAQGVIASTIFQLPFCILSIYIFDYKLYAQKDYILLATISLAMAFSILLVNLISLGIMLNKKINNLKDNELFMHVITHSVFNLSSGILLSYGVYHIWKFPFICFVIFIHLWSCLLVGFYALIKR
jgi:hypothetical protein